jgi:O-Antigen ligase
MNAMEKILMGLTDIKQMRAVYQVIPKKEWLSQPHQMATSLGLIFHLALLASIAGLLMLDCHELAIFSLQVNMVYVGLLLFTSIHRQTNILSPPSYLLILLLLVAAYLYHFDHVELLYINWAVLLGFVISLFRAKKNAVAKELLCIVAFPLAFTLLNCVATSSHYIGEFAWNLWYATFIAVGIWLLAQQHLNAVRKYAPSVTLLSIAIYTLLLLQMPIRTAEFLRPFKFFDIGFSYAIPINTGHLSIYSALALVIAVGLIVVFRSSLKPRIAALGIALVYHVMVSTWIPVVLGLLSSAMLVFCLFHKRKVTLLVTAIALLQIVFAIGNFANYRERLTGLVQKIGTDERVVIWSDAWKMQAASSWPKWVYGHGLNSFLTDFRAYSTYTEPRYSNVEKVDVETFIRFRSPHNVFLDVLYTSGVIGLILATLLYFLLYTFFIKVVYRRRSSSSVVLACTMLGVLTTSLVSNGLNFPFFSRFHIYPLAFICGVLFFLKESSATTTEPH